MDLTTSCLTMSELMGDIRAEPKPGAALRTMVKEHRHLDEFMAMVKEKYATDRHLSHEATLTCSRMDLDEKQ